MPARGGARLEWGKAMRAEIRLSLVILLVVALFAVALHSVGVNPFRLAGYAANLILFVAAWFVMSSVRLVWHLLRDRPAYPLAYLWIHDFGHEYRARLMHSWPILLAAIIFLPTFSAMKSAIPLFQDYRWDQSFIDLDQLIHGTDAWRMLQPVLGFPILTFAISTLYQIWILLIYMGTIFVALHVGDRNLRLRYFKSFFAIWTVNGVLLAIAFASVGPCFAGAMLDNHHFAEQMDYLHRANMHWPIMSIEVQQQLIRWHGGGSAELGRGISAMPSMHVSLAVLFFLAARRINRAMGVFFGIYAAVILIGSVHLAYHYAIDGYLSIVTTLLLWGAFRRRAAATNGVQPPSVPDLLPDRAR